MTFTIESNCANSGRPIRIDIDSEMNITGMSEGSDPYYSMALIDTNRMKEASIVDVF